MAVMLTVQSDSWRGLSLLSDAWDLHVCMAYSMEDEDVLKCLVSEYEKKGVWCDGRLSINQ